jgi:hypothetical protein
VSVYFLISIIPFIYWLFIFLNLMRGNFVAIAALSIAMLAGAETSLFAGDDKSRTDVDIVILQSTDPAPATAEKITTVELGASTTTTSYFEIVAQAKAIAREYNANIVKIAEKLPARGVTRPVKAILYKAENVRPFEKEFGWEKGRKLSWDDFRGPVPRAASDITAAATFCGIGFETNAVNPKNNNLKIHVYNTFYTNNSWARPEDKDSFILAHEQGHFDLCELYTRKLRERLNSVNVNSSNLRAALGTVYDEVQREYNNRQEQYEDETEHGVVLAEQERWQNKLQRELEASEGWME